MHSLYGMHALPQVAFGFPPSPLYYRPLPFSPLLALYIHCGVHVKTLCACWGVSTIDTSWGTLFVVVVYLLLLLLRLLLLVLPAVVVVVFFFCPRGLTFTWWGCYGLCPRHKPTESAHSFLVCFCVYFCPYGPFQCISFYIFSRRPSVSALYPSSLIFALLVLSTIYLFTEVSFSLSGSLGSKHQLINCLLLL